MDKCKNSEITILGDYIANGTNIYNDYSNSQIHIDLVEINIGEINIGDINVTVNDPSPSSIQGYRGPNFVGSSGFTEEEIESRMKFFKANSP